MTTRFESKPAAVPSPKSRLGPVRIRRADPVIVGALLVGAALRLLGLGDFPLAPAELAAWQAATGNWADALTAAAAAGQPPFAYLVIHAAADDYKSQPSGAAGDRIACGVISTPK